MDSGRMPACVVIPLVGESTAGVPNVLNRADDTSTKNAFQPLYGNKCGHDKNSFKTLKLHEKTKRRPHVLEEAKRRIKQAINEIYRYPAFTRVFYHSAQEEKSGRRRRSERIESSISLALSACLQNTNLYKMACGFFDNRNRFHYYNYSYIENQTDMNSMRVKRGMLLLQELGILKVFTSREQNNDGSWRTTEVRIEMTDKIFDMLDLTNEFLKDRETSAIRFHEKQMRLDKNQKKRGIYKKPAFTPPRVPNSGKIKSTLYPQRPASVDNNIPQNLQSVTRKLTNPYQPQQKGRGQEIKELYANLTAQGLTPQEAATFIRNKYPPP